MFNFSNVKDLVIPEGIVTKIVSAGRTLWESVKWDVIYGDSPAYVQAVPPECRSDNKINKIGGKSVAANQQIDLSKAASTPSADVTYSDNMLKITPIGTGLAQCSLEVGVTYYASHKLYVRYDCKTAAWGNQSTTLIFAGYWIDFAKADTNKTDWQTVHGVGMFPNTNIGDNQIRKYHEETNAPLYIKNVLVIDLTQMFGAGNEPTVDECKKIFNQDYYPYNAGELVSASSKKLVSKGKNLLTNADDLLKASGWVKNADGSYTGYVAALYEITNTIDTQVFKLNYEANTQYTFSCDFEYENTGENLPFFWGVWYSDGTRHASSMSNKGRITITSEANKTVVGMRLSYGENRKMTIKNVQVEKSTEATPYSPYKEPVELVTDYGVLRSAGNVYDYVDLDRSVIVRRVGVVDLGSADWLYNTTFWTTPIAYTNLGNSKVNTHNSLLAEYEQMYVISNGQKHYCVSSTYLYIEDSEITSVVDLKAKLNGVLFYYELAEPVEEPITVKGNKLPVEAGGTLTFINDTDYHLPVPNEVEYYVRLDEIENLVNAMYLSDLDEVLKNDL